MSNLFPPKPHRGRMFRDLRHRQGLSLQALGAAVGVDPSTISRWEARKEFHQFMRFVMALHRLGMTPEAFFELAAPTRLETLPKGDTPRPDSDRYAVSGYTNRLQKWGV